MNWACWERRMQKTCGFRTLARTGVGVLAPVLLAIMLLALPARSSAQETAATEEFVGPFPSWRQVQCTGQDDTALLQNELNTLGRSGSPVLYINPGTCRITETLHLGQDAGRPRGVQSVTILGHDPGDTSIVWAGPAGKGTRMFELGGVAYSRFGRLTWDGGGAADIVYYDDWGNTGDYFPTGNRHEDEVFENLWSGGGIAFVVGAKGFGGSEWDYMRCKFIGPMEAGIFLLNFNALDHWVWDSLFQDVQHGVTNSLPDRKGGAGGAWGVNRSVFLNNGDDMSISNTEFFSSRWNYSRGSHVHVHSYSIGAAPSPWTSQGETIIDPASNTAPFSFGASGPLGIIDATVRAGSDGKLGSVVEGYASPAGGDLWSLHNAFAYSSANVYEAGHPGGPGRVHVGTDDAVGQTIDDPGPPSLPPTPPASALPVIEVQNGDIAAALAQAADDRVIVHVPFGNYSLNQTLEVGRNVVLTGDGYGATQLNSTAGPALHLAGPSHATLRDFSVNGSGKGNGSAIVIDNADQPGGLIHAEDWTSAQNHVGWSISDLSSTIVDLFDDQTHSNTRTNSTPDQPGSDYLVRNSTLHIFNGAGASSDQMYELHGGEIVADTRYYEGSPGGGVTPALVAPSSNGTLVLDQGSFNPSKATLDTSTFSGLFTMIDIISTASGTRTFGANSLVLGLDFGSVNDAAPPKLIDGPSAVWLARHSDRGGSEPVAEQVLGLADEAQFLRDHLAPLRAAQPQSLTRRSDGVTDVRLYRLGASGFQYGIRVVGSAP
jgi:hypothetical protein